MLGSSALHEWRSNRRGLPQVTELVAMPHLKGPGKEGPKEIV